MSAWNIIGMKSEINKYSWVRDQKSTVNFGQKKNGCLNNKPKKKMKIKKSKKNLRYKSFVYHEYPVPK